MKHLLKVLDVLGKFKLIVVSIPVTTGLTIATRTITLDKKSGTPNTPKPRLTELYSEYLELH
jgi:hypothetical protein